MTAISILADSSNNEIVVNERSTLAITVNFTDDDGNAVVPSSAAWTLIDKNGTIINNREDEIISPAASVTIVLVGDDLQITDGEDTSNVVLREFLIEGTYNSSIGYNLPFKETCYFYVRNLFTVS